MSYSKIALVISIIGAVFCLLYESVFLKYEAPNDFIYALGVVTNCVALSVIASCIFYFVTVYFPKKHERDQIRKHIISNLELLEGIGKNAFKDIVKRCNPNEQEFTENCNQDLMQRLGSSNQDNPLFAKASNWFEYFDRIHKTEKSIIQQLMIFESMIPIEVRLELIELQKQNTLFSDSKSFQEVYNSDITKRSIRVYSKDIYSHLLSLTELKNIYNKTSKI